ncbi:hypothetical protein ACLOJK_017531 [Asimina triloba]
MTGDSSIQGRTKLPLATTHNTEAGRSEATATEKEEETEHGHQGHRLECGDEAPQHAVDDGDPESRPSDDQSRPSRRREAGEAEFRPLEGSRRVRGARELESRPAEHRRRPERDPSHLFLCRNLDLCDAASPAQESRWWLYITISFVGVCKPFVVIGPFRPHVMRTEDHPDRPILPRRKILTVAGGNCVVSDVADTAPVVCKTVIHVEMKFILSKTVI